MIAHIVLFNRKPGIRDDQLRSFALQLRSLLAAARGVLRVAIGRSVAIDAGYQRSFGDKTYEYAAVIEFDGEESLRSYLQHPLHEAVGRIFWEFCSSTVIAEMRMIDLASGNVDELLV